MVSDAGLDFLMLYIFVTFACRADWIAPDTRFGTGKAKGGCTVPGSHGLPGRNTWMWTLLNMWHFKEKKSPGKRLRPRVAHRFMK